VGKRPQEQILGEMMEKLAHVGKHREDDGFGNVVWVKGLGLTEQDITVDHDTVTGKVLIQVRYAREVVMTPFKKIKVVKFAPKAEGIPKF
jgi:hypothetical protein